MDSNSKRNLILVGIYLIVIFLSGIAGYMFIDDYSFVDAFYMTVITISTVGFREAQPLSDAGKIFTAGLIFLSLGVFTYFITLLTQNLFQRQLSFIYPAFNKRKKRRSKMENHVIVVGYGRNGDQVVKELSAFGSKIVVIDENHELIISNIGTPVRFIEGNATHDEVLLKADIKKARSLITTLPNDADNLFVVLTARALNPDLKIISRASSDTVEKKLRMAGVDSVVMPERVGGAHMATLIAQPDLIEFLEHLTLHSDSPTILMEVTCKEIPDKIRSIPIKDLAIRKLSGANIIGMKKAQGELILNPSPDTRLHPDSKLFVLGTSEQIEEMKKIICGKFNPEKMS